MTYEWFPLVILAVGLVVALFLVVVMAFGVVDMARKERDTPSDTL